MKYLWVFIPIWKINPTVTLHKNVTMDVWQTTWDGLSPDYKCYQKHLCSIEYKCTKATFLNQHKFCDKKKMAHTWLGSVG